MAHLSVLHDRLLFRRLNLSTYEKGHGGVLLLCAWVHCRGGEIRSDGEKIAKPVDLFGVCVTTLAGESVVIKKHRVFRLLKDEYDNLYCVGAVQEWIDEISFFPLGM